jgi:hypothetical protein
VQVIAIPPEAAFELGPERLVGDRVLQFSEIEVLKLSGQGYVMVGVDGGILPGCGLELVFTRS